MFHLISQNIRTITTHTPDQQQTTKLVNNQNPTRARRRLHWTQRLTVKYETTIGIVSTILYVMRTPRVTTVFTVAGQVHGRARENLKLRKKYERRIYMIRIYL